MRRAIFHFINSHTLFVEIFIGTILVLAMGFVVGTKTVSHDYFFFDEADYMYAVHQGVANNYLDRGAIPFGHFLKMGFSKGRHKGNNKDLSDYIRSSGDISFYRHYHGPLYFYWLSLGNVFGFRTEASYRWLGYSLVFALIVLMIAGLYSATDSKDLSTILLGPLMLVMSYTVRYTFSQLTPHAIYLVTSLATLIFSALYLKTNNRKYHYLCMISIGLSFLSIEYAILLAITIVLTLWLFRAKLFRGWDLLKMARFAGISLAFFLVPIISLWPSGIFKCTLIKDYLFFAYFALVRGDAYGTDSFWTAWYNRMAAAPMEYSIIIITLFLTPLILRKKVINIPFLIYAILIIITMFRNNSPIPNYVSSLMPCLFFISSQAVGIIFQRLKKPADATPFAVILVALAALNNPVLALNTEGPFQKSPANAIIDAIKAENKHSRVLVPRGYIMALHFYFPDRPFITYAENIDRIRSIDSLAIKEQCSGIIYEGTNAASLENMLSLRVSFQPDTLACSVSGGKMIFYHLSNNPEKQQFLPEVSPIVSKSR